METNAIIGRNMRIIRDYYNYSLGYVELRSGISKSMLSRMERDLAPISAAGIKLLADMYKINVLLFFIYVDDDHIDRYLKLVDKRVDFEYSIEEIEQLIDVLD
jgi:transcriptional regulator with XRE-family HTH domain